MFPGTQAAVAATEKRKEKKKRERKRNKEKAELLTETELAVIFGIYFRAEKGIKE